MASFKAPLTSFPHRWGYAPDEDIGPQYMAMKLDFNAQGKTEIAFDAELAQFANQISNIQAVFINNPNNVTVTLIADGSRYTLIAKPYSQGWYPWISGDQLKGIGRASATTADVEIAFTNVPLCAGPWATQ